LGNLENAYFVARDNHLHHTRTQSAKSRIYKRFEQKFIYIQGFPWRNIMSSQDGDYWLMPLREDSDENQRSTISSLTWNTYSFSSWSSLPQSASKRRRILVAAFVLFLLLLVIIVLLARRNSTETSVINAPPTLTVGSWNVMCEDDEWSESWGPPVEKSLCEANKTECTKLRREREWRVLEEALDLDVIALQEAEDGFFELQPEDSVWEVAAMSGQCSLLVRRGGEWSVLEVFNLEIADMTGCDFAPAVALSRGDDTEKIVFSSVHVQASVSDMDSWYEEAAKVISAAGVAHTYPISIIGGDFNHNASSASSLPEGWGISAPHTMLSDGTSQHQDGWMGSFDQFFHSSSSSDLRLTTKAIVRGFMPKSVEGFEQGGNVVERAQFRSLKENSELWFDATFEFVGGEKIVPDSSPVSDAMSDHLLTISIIYV